MLLLRGLRKSKKRKKKQNGKGGIVKTLNEKLKTFALVREIEEEILGTVLVVEDVSVLLIHSENAGS